MMTNLLQKFDAPIIHYLFEYLFTFRVAPMGNVIKLSLVEAIFSQRQNNKVRKVP
jgi:hypothetical protein